jgi:hypothetical protein
MEIPGSVGLAESVWHLKEPIDENLNVSLIWTLYVASQRSRRCNTRSSMSPRSRSSLTNFAESRAIFALAPLLEASGPPACSSSSKFAQRRRMHLGWHPRYDQLETSLNILGPMSSSHEQRPTMIGKPPLEAGGSGHSRLAGADLKTK